MLREEKFKNRILGTKRRFGKGGAVVQAAFGAAGARLPGAPRRSHQQPAGRGPPAEALLLIMANKKTDRK